MRIRKTDLNFNDDQEGDSDSVSQHDHEAIYAICFAYIDDNLNLNDDQEGDPDPVCQYDHRAIYARSCLFQL